MTCFVVIRKLPPQPWHILTIVGVQKLGRKALGKPTTPLWTNELSLPSDSLTHETRERGFSQIPWLAEKLMHRIPNENRPIQICLPGNFATGLRCRPWVLPSVALIIGAENWFSFYYEYVCEYSLKT
jgi:hypothetical protein